MYRVTLWHNRVKAPALSDPWQNSKPSVNWQNTSSDGWLPACFPKCECSWQCVTLWCSRQWLKPVCAVTTTYKNLDISGHLHYKILLAWHFTTKWNSNNMTIVIQHALAKPLVEKDVVVRWAVLLPIAIPQQFALRDLVRSRSLVRFTEPCALPFVIPKNYLKNCQSNRKEGTNGQQDLGNVRVFAHSSHTDVNPGCCSNAAFCTTLDLPCLHSTHWPSMSEGSRVVAPCWAKRNPDFKHCVSKCIHVYPTMGMIVMLPACKLHHQPNFKISDTFWGDDQPNAATKCGDQDKQTKGAPHNCLTKCKILRLDLQETNMLETT